MKTQEYEVLQRSRDWLDDSQHVYLCTIVKCTGSSPRPLGSLLACTALGEQVGSLSGGCVEDDLLEKIAAGELLHSPVQLIEYGVSAEENERLGLPCGGRLRVLVQVLEGPSIKHNWLASVLQALDTRSIVRRAVDLNSGTTEVLAGAQFEPLQFTEDYLLQSFGPRMRLLLVGAGQLSQSLAELAQAMDYELIVTDPRQHMLQQWGGPDVELVGGMPDDVIRERASDQHSIVITLTHDPRIDDMALMEALTTEVWYVGALGSHRTTQKRLERLRQLDLSAAQLAKLHAPVGLDIGSKTPIEIAISIMAELTALRRDAAPK